MKRFLAIIFALSICFLSACSNEKNVKSSSDNYNSTETSVSTESNVDSSVAIESNQNNDSSMLQTPHRPKTFELLEEEADLETFVDWCKQCRTDDLMKIKYVDNTDFISFLKTTDTLLLPKMKKEGYDLAKVSVAVGRLWYSYWIFYSSGEDVLNTAFKPISKELREHSPKRILEDYISSFPEDYEIVENGMSRFGEYISLDTEKDPDSWAQTVFIVDDYIITASCNGEWKNEYFDYFDFEKVTLK